MAESVIIIGGGASGLMAGITAARRGVRVTILEQNEKPGRKIIASGNGRCNFTNRRLEERYYHGSDRSFIRHVIDRFNAEDAIAFFREIGLIPMEERDGWMYPLSGQSSAVLDLLLMEAERLKVKIKTNEHVTSVEKSEQGFTVITESWHYEADACVVASGSPASSVHGSTGDAAKIAERFGIAVKPYRPALVPLKIEGNSTALWAGTRVAASVSVLADGKKIAEDRGEVQLTEYGISGIPVFQVSGACVSAIDEGKTAEAVLNFLPEIGKEELRSLLEARKETLHLRKKED
ncbi:MAG: aminoacetone oxidase family FAD-binding enzyme, partial [Eubacterium sp.]|nr:aminoacetone oxidase family FAD-binding enzyme [Eubacterium sp.]